MFNWDNIKSKQLYGLITSCILVLVVSSCRTCKCPAYSENSIPSGKSLQSVAVNNLEQFPAYTFNYKPFITHQGIIE
jgi:hypothetical protein